MAIYSATSRGRVQLIYGGQPFIFEKNLKLPNGAEKKFWRCNQWWNQKCRSRVYTINDTVVPLNRYHTHEEIVKRKKRARKVTAAATTIPNTSAAARKAASTNKVASASLTSGTITDGGTIEVTPLGMHLKYEEIVADVTEVVEPTITLTTKDIKK